VFISDINKMHFYTFWSMVLSFYSKWLSDGRHVRMRQFFMCTLGQSMWP